MKVSTRSHHSWSAPVVVAVITILTLLIPANLARSAPVLEAASAAQPDSPAGAHVEKAQAALAASKFIDAENELRLAIAADPAYAPVYGWMGQLLALQPGREKEALQNGEKAAGMAPKDARTLALLADVQVREDMLVAVKTAEQAVQLAPEDPVAQAALALAYLQDAQWEKAQAAASKAVKLDPKLAYGYYALGLVYDSVADGVRAPRVRASDQAGTQLGAVAGFVRRCPE